jgi:hypothetical protein
MPGSFQKRPARSPPSRPGRAAHRRSFPDQRKWFDMYG